MRELAVLVNAPVQPGRYRVLFDAGQLASGLYLAVLRSGTGLRTIQMLVAR